METTNSSRKGSISRRLLAYYLPMICLGMLAVYGTLETRDYRAKMDVLHGDLEQFTLSHAAMLATPVRQSDTKTLEILVSVIASDPDAYDVRVTDTGGNEIARAAAEAPGLSEFPVIRSRHPIVFTDTTTTETVGFLHVGFHTRRVRDGVTQHLITDAVALLVMAALLIASTLFVTRKVISKPIRTLHESISTIRHEDRPEPVEWRYNDELGNVVSAYNLMREHQYRTEQQLRDFARATSDWYWEMDENLRFTYFSDHHKAIIGFDLSIYIGKTRREILADRAADKKWAAHLDDLDNRRPFRDFRYSLTKPHGGELTVSTSGTPLFDKDGTFCGYRGSGTDITEQAGVDQTLRDTVASLQESEARLRQAARLTRVGYWLWDEVEDRAISCSEECARIHGVSVEEFIERMGSAEQDAYWTHPDDREMYSTRIRAGWAENTVLDMEYRLLTPQGEVRYVRDISEPEYDENGVIVRSIGSIQDTTEQKMAELALREAKEEAERASATKDDFLAHMSHELRTPLNSIIGFSEMMNEQVFGKLSNEKYRDYVSEILLSGRHLLKLINNILDIAGIKASKQALDESDIDLDALLASAIRIVQGRQDARSITIDYRPSGDIPKIRGDERLVRQIFFNLLGNAVKYSLENGSVTVSAAIGDNHEMQVVISDVGVGIAAEDIEKVLEPFGQARSGAHMAHEGTGLGLPLSRHFIELHDGSLTLESQPDVGTTVTITFPPDRVLVAGDTS